MEDLSDEEAEVEGLVSSNYCNRFLGRGNQNPLFIQNNEIRKRGFSWLVPIGRLFTDQEEKNDVCIEIFSRQRSSYYDIIGRRR